MHNALIYGLVNGYDDAAALNSFVEEFWLSKERMNIWGRIEHLQRTPAQLQISPSNEARWVTALTLGYTHRLWRGDCGLGGSVTKDLLPADFRIAYGGDPWTGTSSACDRLENS